jgi:hypothetical protein
VSDTARAGPLERKRGPAGNQPNFKAATNHIRSLDDLHAWCERAGIPLVSLSPSLHLEQLVDAGVSAWIVADCWARTDDEEALGIKHATRVIWADDLNTVCAEAARLAGNGERVLLLEEPDAEPATDDAGRDSLK